jgi:fructokinase
LSRYIVCIGEMLIDFIPDLPSSGGVAGSPCYHPHPGGAPANVAVAIARLGGASRFIGKLSEDGFGQMLAQVLIDNHVDTLYLKTTRQAPTSLAMVTLLANGERQFTFYRTGTADALLEVSDLDWNAWQDAVICHAGSVSLSIEPSRSATLAALDYTRQAGCIATFDANVRPALWASNADIQEAIEDVIGRTDVLKFSSEEAVFMGELEALPATGPDVKQLYTLGVDLLTRGPSLVIITRNAQGALLMTADFQVEVPAPPVSPIDTTGAGDAFMGAILYQLVQRNCSTPADVRRLSEEDLRDLGSFANRVAGLSITRYGGISSLPFINEL